MVRAGLRQFLVDDRSITEIGEAASGNETLDKLRSGSWDLVILDINMPDRSGLTYCATSEPAIRTPRCWCSAAFPSVNMPSMC